jgi:hypothetical protein
MCFAHALSQITLNLGIYSTTNMTIFSYAKAKDALSETEKNRIVCVALTVIDQIKVNPHFYLRVVKYAH